MKLTLLIAGLVLTVAATAVEAQNAASTVGPNALPGLTPLPAAVPVGTHVGAATPTGYEDGGRRDPFSALVAPKKASGSALTSRPRVGIASLVLADIAIRGLVKVGDTWQATLEGANKQSYVVRAKDKLFDATVQSVDEQGVWFLEEVGAGTPPQRVRRVMRAAGEESR